MTRLDLANAAAACLATLVGLGLAGTEERFARNPLRQSEAGVAPSTRTRLSDGSAALSDATGTAVPLVRYERIVSGSLVADPVLLELCEREQIAALTDRVRDNPRYARRANGLATIVNPSAIEPVLALAPDLLIVSHFANPQVLMRLRERGVRVFDLGPMHGMESVLDDIVAIGELCGAPDRGRTLAAELGERMQGLVARVPARARPRGLYLAAYGTKLFGGARRTSYHDVLEAAGVTDAAADRWDGWPELGAEAVLALDPDMLVTKRGMAGVICRAPGFDLARACREGRVVEIEGTLIDDPGLGMADAAEALFTKVHGEER